MHTCNVLILWNPEKLHEMNTLIKRQLDTLKLIITQTLKNLQCSISLAFIESMYIVLLLRNYSEVHSTPAWPNKTKDERGRSEKDF